MLFQCDEFECEKQLTLNKDKNTKHTKANSTKDNSVNKVSNTKDKFHCDECSYSSMSKKSLKKHKSQKHQIPQTALQIKCDKCNITFEERTELLAHVEEKPICRLRPLDAVLSSGLCGKGGGLTSHDRANSSENYLLLGFLLVKPSQAVLLLVKQSFT